MWVTEACFTLTFNCPIQISKFFHKTSTVTCPLPANLIKSVDIEKNSQSTKTSYGPSRGQTKLVRLESPYMANRLLQFSMKSTNAENISQSRAHVSYNTNTLSKAS